MARLSQASATLAIHGGQPVRRKPMPPRFGIGKTERAKIFEVLNYYREIGLDPGYQGHFEELYCRSFTKFLGGGYADAVATGTAAVFVALAALELPEGSEVLVSPITDPGTLSAIILNRLTPRLVDAAPESFNIGPEQVTNRITNETRALIVVHLAGRAAAIDAIVTEACRRGIRIIEDCSQAHGATWKGQQVGTFGDIACFSTMNRKAHITSGSGGVVFSRDKGLFRKALAHADRGKPRWAEDFDDRNPNTFLFPALNLHTDEISCAIGIASLARIRDSISRRLKFVRGVAEGLIGNSRACAPYRWSDADSPFIYPVLVNSDRLRCSKIEFAEAVRAEGIGLNPHYQYVARDWPWLKPYLQDDFDTANAKRIRDSAFCLYLNENYGKQEIHDTLTAILKVENHFLE